ncbi:SNF2 family N-terminal domain-containing protein [Apiospora hydei]|uniref:SNF2 family N-terminal domain-containing protein n=1 Tax=Apiospora hydei TaxID=1337664 RepID=A0ABR1WCB5_9PEZI
MAATSTFSDEHMLTEEKKARAENTRAEAKRLAQIRNKRKKSQISPQERAARAKELDELLRQSKIFSDILTKKTKALGRVGRDFDNQALAEAGLELKPQPKIMTGGTMRDYQLEGLTWMYEICLQGLSGILADEMGLGKTIQTISLVALLREQETYYGPHLIIAPLSTLSNWQNEFEKWTPSIPFVMYHGKPEERQAIFKNKIWKHYAKGRPTEKFPVVCTSYEMILKDRAALSKIDWAFIVVDEGHRMKNADSKLFRELQQFKSATRLLITGTPLQNNLKELWSLLHFLMPQTFLDWEAFEDWFDFSDLQNEEGTEQFIEDKNNQDLVKKIHNKREYVLYAPMTKEQTDLYNVISDRGTDTRAYLENKVVESLATSVTGTPSASTRSSRQSSRAGSTRPSDSGGSPNNAFSMMMGKRNGARSQTKTEESGTTTPSKTSGKRKAAAPTTETPQAKSTKSSRQSTPASNSTGRGRGRPRKTAQSYKVPDDSDDDKLDDDAFEAKLAAEMEAVGSIDEDFPLDEEETARAATLELAKMQISDKKLGNALMQLRLVCNSPHNFYNPWTFDENTPVDESIVTSSGKMLLLDRMLPNYSDADTSDWNPQQDLQAQDRCHRIGQTRPVVVYRLATKGTVEDELLMSADAKRRLEKLVILKGGFKSMGQKLDQNELLDKETLRALLLKEGEVYQHSGNDRIFSDEDLDVLCDRSDSAYDRAASGAGNSDGFQVVDTAVDGIKQIKTKEQ